MEEPESIDLPVPLTALTAVVHYLATLTGYDLRPVRHRDGQWCLHVVKLRTRG